MPIKFAFEQFLRNEMQLDEHEVALTSLLAKARRLRRNESLLAAGEVCRYKIFIHSGLLKAYTLSPEGNETIFHFLPEQTWTSLDVESYDKQSPSSFHIAAIEPAELLIWNKRDFEQLLSDLPVLKKHADQLGARKVYLSKQRLMNALAGSPEEKYEQFNRNHPGLLARVPLHMIAAYLGVSVKTITRIRHAQWTN